MRFTRTLTHFANRSWKKKLLFGGVPPFIIYVYVYTNVHLMFNLGLCEKKNASFFSFVFCFLRKKKTRQNTVFTDVSAVFTAQKTPQFPRTSHHSFVSPPPFFLFFRKRIKKKSAPLGCPPLTCVPHVSYSMRRPRFRMRSDDSSARRRSSCSSPANSIARRTRVTSSSLSVSLSSPAREPSVM